MGVPHSSNKKQNENKNVSSKKKSFADVWFDAARDGNLAVIQRYLNSSWDVNKPNGDWKSGPSHDGPKTALHFAARSGHIEIVKLLLEHGADINAKAGPGLETALHLAAGSGHFEIVQLLLANGANINAKACTWYSPDLPYPRGPDEPEPEGLTTLHYATGGGHFEIVKLLIEHGVDINARAEDHGHNPHHHELPKTALHFAARSGHIEIVKLLLEHGADINAKVSPGLKTALHFAAENGHIESVKLLLEHGADINAKEGLRDKTALHFAARSGHIEIVKLLLEHGADINAKAMGRMTALEVAKDEGQTKVFGFICQWLEEKLDVDPNK